MMQGFEDVTFEWKGEKYTVPANRQMMLIAKIESALAGDTGRQALDMLLQAGGPPHGALAMAYEAALRYAGAVIEDGEVYMAIMADFAEGRGEVATKVNGAILSLLAVIAPPVHKAIVDTGEPKKKAGKA